MKSKIIIIGCAILTLVLILPNVSAVPLTDDLYINADTTIDPGVYNLVDASVDGIIRINASNVVITMEDVWVTSGDTLGYGIFTLANIENVTINGINASINSYDVGFYAQTGDDNITLYGSSANNFVINDSSSRGIDLFSGSNYNLTNVKVINSNTDGMRIQSDSISGVGVYDCNFTGNGQHGIHIKAGSSDVIINNSYLVDNADTSNEYNIYIDGDSGVDPTDITISYNTMEAGIGASFDIYADEVGTLIVDNNNFTSNNAGTRFIDGTDVTVSNNDFTSIAGQGIHFNQTVGTISGNTLDDAGGYGIYAEMADSQSVQNINITDNTLTSMTGNTNIYVTGFPYEANISGNTISGTDQISIYVSNLLGTSHVDDNSITSTGHGIVIDTAVNSTTTFNNNNIPEAFHAIRMLVDAGTINVTNTTIQDDGTGDVDQAAYIYTDCTINFINTTYNTTELLFEDNTGTFNAYWYARVYVEDNLGAAVNGANVTLNDSTPTEIFNVLTDATGYTDYYLVQASTQDNTTVTSYNDFNASATKSMLTDSSTSQTIDSRDETITVTLTGATAAAGGGGGGPSSESTQPFSIAPEDLEGEKGIFEGNTLYYILGAVGIIVVLSMVSKGKLKK